MTDDLIERLREVGGMSDDGATRWYINPDGPEAADRIEKLEAALRMAIDWDNTLDWEDGPAWGDLMDIARKALEGKDE